MSWSYMYTPDVMPRAYMTVTEILEKSAAKFSKHEAFVHRFTGGERESITCEELATKAKVVGKYLVGIGVKPGDKVALVGSNSINWIISEYGILFSGGISVHINVANRDASDLRDIFESANCCGIIFEKQNNVDLETCIEQLLREETMCSFVLGINKLSTGYKNIDEILNENAYLETHLPDTYPEDPAVIFSTSGSTGKPKLVLHNHISAAAMAIHNMFTENSAIYFSDRPFEWGGGNVFGLRLDRPVKRVFGDTKETAYQGSAKKLWKILQEEKCDGAMLLPYILFDLSKEIDNLVPFKLNVLMTGGQIVDKKYKWLIGRVCNRLGIIYGATEVIENFDLPQNTNTR